MAKQTELRYLQYVVGKGKPISYIKLAEILGMDRQSVYARLRRPFIEWKVGWLVQIAKILNYDFGEMVERAIEFEGSMDEVSVSEPRDTRRKRSQEQTATEQQ